MGFLGLGKKGGVIDLTGRLPQKSKENTNQSSEYVQVAEQTTQKEQTTSLSSTFGFFGNYPKTSAQESTETTNSQSESSMEQKRKLAKRLLDITTKLEDISNQIYHIQQRIEVLERKADVNRF